MISASSLLPDDVAASEEEVLLVLSNVTEQRPRQARFQEQSRLASVGQLAAGVAHEINNPLAARHGLSELLEMDSPKTRIKED
ncbi:MAG: hypothetical protein H8E48_01390 [Chloroflexi bacterium]|nr:hypothetical protein [Chloroflexota bacterium]